MQKGIARPDFLEFSKWLDCAKRRLHHSRVDTSPQDLLGEAALALNPRALNTARGGARARVAFRGVEDREELRTFFGADLRLEGSGSGGSEVADFSLERISTNDRPSSPRARALLAAALARAAPARPPRILGVLNVTPDSFSDGGRWDDQARAVEHGLALLAEGADALDIGGESTRPGSSPIDLDEERRRVLPVIRELRSQTKLAISVDTTKARLAAEALDAGATIVNDISAGRFDPEMIPLIARRGCGFALMHMQGLPLDMQRAPAYDDVVDDVLAFLRERASVCWHAGIAAEHLWVDPGIGFGKTLDHNLALLARLAELRSLGIPILVGTSRKSFIGQIESRSTQAPATAVHDRLGGSAAALTACVQAGAELLRVHDVRVMLQAARVAWAIAAH